MGQPGSTTVAGDLSDAGTPPSDRPFRPDIQGLRALAVALVVIFHFSGSSQLLPGGFIGVDVFFVISGFVITGLLLRERGGRRAGVLLDFYARRARRIIPAVTVVILVTVVATYHWLGVLRGNEVAGDGRWSAVFLANAHFIAQGTNYFQALVPPSPLLHLWSLAVEEQFYLAFPLLFLGLMALAPGGRWRRTVVVGLVAVIGASLALSALQTASDPTVAYFSPFTRAWELAAGALLAVLAPKVRSVPPVAGAAASWLGLAMILAGSVAFSASTPYPGVAAVVPVVGASLVLAGGLVAPPRRGAELVLGTWVGLRGGEISYSLYLWHFPVIIIAEQQISSRLHATTRVGLLVLSVLLAVASTRLIEDPIRHAPRLRASRGKSLGLGAALIALVLLVCTVMLSSHAAGRAVSRVPGPAHPGLGRLSSEIAQAATARSLPTPMVSSLLDVPATPLHPPSIPDRCIADSAAVAWVPLCVVGDTSAHRTLVLLGDSQANAWSGAVEQVALAEHLRLVVVAMNGCQPWYLPTGSSAGDRSCASFRRRSLVRVMAVHPTDILVAGNKSHGFTSAQNAAGLDRLLRALAPAHAAVTVLGSIPWFAGAYDGPPPAECAARYGAEIQRCSLPTTTLRASFGGFDAAMRAAALHRGDAYLPVHALFCTAARCPVAIGHRFVYEDRVHMTWQYSSYIGRALDDLLAPDLRAPA